MKRLTPEFQSETGAEKKLSEFVEGLKVREHDKKDLRGKIIEEGFEIMCIAPREPESAKILCCDSSVVSKSLRFLNIWGVHAITLYAEFDSKEHEDPLVGHGRMRYGSIMYDSGIALRESASSEELEKGLNSFRILMEYGNLLRGYETLAEDGKKPDFLIVDGSLYTNSKNMDDSCAESKLPNCVGMVEDSHSVDITSGLGLSMSNLNLFDLILEPLEYVVDRKESTSVCYLKLPSKNLDFLPSKKSEPVTVRWEFSYPDFEKDLCGLTGIWMADNDALHSQIYPLRIADYLTRRIKVSALLDEVTRRGDLLPEFRDMREPGI